MSRNEDLPGLDEVVLGQRSYEPGPQSLHIVNDLGGFMFVMPTLQGRVRLRRNGELVHDGPAGPGMLRVLPPGEGSSLSDVANMATIVLQVPDATVVEAGRAAGLSRSGLWTLPPVIGPTPEFRRLVRSFARLELTDVEHGPALSRGLTRAMLTLSLGIPISSTRDRRRLALTDEQWHSAVAFADASMAIGIDLRTWAAVIGLPPAQFASRFRERAGRPPYAWFADRRVEHAKTLLLQDVSLIEVALRLGYNSQSHFTDAFRRRVGVSPGAWVRRIAL